MIIILEGNEANFKTTVGKKLSEKLRIPLIKGSSFELSKCSNEELFKHFKSLAESDNVIYDRFIYSNLVYASLYDDYAILSDEQVSEIEQMIKNKATVYYLFADTDVIKKRIRKRGDEYVTENKIQEINDTYSKVMMNSKLKTIFYDTNEWTSDEIVNEILKDYKNKINE